MSTSTSTPPQPTKAEDVGSWSTTDWMVCGGAAFAAFYVGSVLSSLRPGSFNALDFTFCLNIFVVVALLYFYFGENDRLMNSMSNKTTVTTVALLVLAVNVASQAAEKLGWKMFGPQAFRPYQGP